MNCRYLLPLLPVSLGALLFGANLTAARPQQADNVLQVRPALPNVGKPLRVRSTKTAFYVLSGADNAIVEYAPNLTMRRRIGRIGNGPGELYHPQDFDVSPDGTLWVADTGNNRIQSFTPTGDPVDSFKINNPYAIAALGENRVAVVETHGSDLARIFSNKGVEVGSITGTTPVPDASEKQTNYFNRARIARTKSGELLFVFRWLLPPTVRIQPVPGGVPRPVAMTSVTLDLSTQRVTAARKEDIKRPGLGGRIILNSGAVDPTNGDIWVAAGVTVLLRFDASGKQLKEYFPRNDVGEPYNILDLALIEHTLLMIAGPNCYTASLK
jgi:hypothetical protein